jgi:hypothetical protein
LLSLGDSDPGAPASGFLYLKQKKRFSGNEKNKLSNFTNTARQSLTRNNSASQLKEPTPIPSSLPQKPEITMD